MIYKIQLKYILLYVLFLVIQLFFFNKNLIIKINIPILIYFLLDLNNFDRLQFIGDYFKDYSLFANISFYLSGFILILVEHYLSGIICILITSLIFNNKK